MNVPQTTSCNQRPPADKPNPYLSVAEAKKILLQLDADDHVCSYNPGKSSANNAEFGYCGNTPMSMDNA